MIVVIRLMALLIGYLLGCFPTGYLVGKSHGIDIRQHGSGNTGATNTLRTLGWTAAILTFFGDCMKTVLSILIANVLFKNSVDDITVIELYAGLGAVLGHNFPFYFKFKGGKGIACTAGLIVFYHPYLILPQVITFFGTFFATHYVSLGSLLVNIVLIAEMVIFGQIGVFGELSQAVLNEMYVVTALLAALAFWGHRANIVRLMNKNERKTYLTKKNEQ